MNVRERLARVVVNLARVINQVMLGKLSGDMARRSISMLDHASYKPYVQQHLSSIREVEEPFVMEYPFPDDYPSFFARSKSFDRRVWYDLDDVCVSPRTGFTWLPEGYAVQESVGSLNRTLTWGDVLHEPLLSTKRLDPEFPIIPCPSGGTSFYHWMLESLPNTLHVVHEVPEAKILVDPESPEYVIDSLREALGEQTLRSRIHFSRQPVKVPRLVMRSFRPGSGFVDPVDVDILRRQYAPSRNSPPNAPKQLYVSRTRTENRPLRHEQELEDALESLGFKVLYAEEYSFREQIQLFSSAETVIAPHGAGLSHMLWMPPSAEVIEILPFEGVNDCFARLALQLDLGYQYVRCSPDEQLCGSIPVSEVMKAINETSSCHSP
jgi:hypothetical protein